MTDPAFPRWNDRTTDRWKDAPYDHHLAAALEAYAEMPHLREAAPIAFIDLMRQIIARLRETRA